MIKPLSTAESRDIYLPETAELTQVRPVTALETFFEMRFASGRELGHMPGQFAEVSVAGVGEAPISVSSSPTMKGSFQMVVRKVGNVTSALHRLGPGATVGVRGPFGTHFPVEEAMKGKDIIVVGAGLGMVPARSVIQYVLHHRSNYGQVTILSGTKTPADRLFVEESKEWARQPSTAYLETVDRGDENWKGPVGVITTLMPGLKINPENTFVVIIGPPVMYKFVLIELDKMKVPKQNIYLSLERHMKCGVGKCGHCQINGIYVCQEGPVFCYADVKAIREAI